MAKSIKVNFTLNAIRTFCTIAFPVVTFAYVSRILDVDGIGMFDYSKSIVSYFVLFAQLGIANYGFRELPKLKYDKEKFSNLVGELFCYNLFATVISYVLFFIALSNIEKLEGYKTLLLINGLNIGFCALGLEWMYGALEEYKYITIRTILFQVLSFVLLLLFVRKKEDINIYAAINVFSSVGSNLLNFIHARHYVQKPLLKIKNIFHHSKYIFVFWANTIAGTLYLTIETTMLGYISGDYSVGLYSASNKICRIFISLVVSICPILLSRSSLYLKENRVIEYNNLTKIAFETICFLAFPITIGLYSYADAIILFFSGSSFLPAVGIAKTLSVLMIIIPVSTFLSMQVLIPFKHEKKILYVLMLATILSAFFSYLFIPSYQHYAAAIINVIIEFIIMISYLYISRHSLSLYTLAKSMWRYLVASILQLLSIMLLYQPCGDSIDYTNIFISGFLSTICYALTLYVLNDPILLKLINEISKKLKHFI